MPGQDVSHGKVLDFIMGKGRRRKSQAQQDSDVPVRHTSLWFPGKQIS